MVGLPEKLRLMLDERESKNALRKLPVPADLADFSSNDYLGLARDPEVFEQAAKLLEDKTLWRNGATGSRLLTGNHWLYEEAEALLCEVFNSEAALIFNSGYDANIGFLSSVPQRTDIVYYDELVHASVRDGLSMGKAKSYKFRHNDLEHLQELISVALRVNPVRPETSIYVITESVFSMDGDSPDLKALAVFCAENDYRLVVDEAHAAGIYGEHGGGLVDQLNIARSTFARIVTFGKAMGCHGAAILGSEELKSYLINFTRSFIYSTGLPPHSIATLIAAYQNVRSAKGALRRQQLGKNIHFFKLLLKDLGLDDRFTSGNAAIHCCIVDGNVAVKKVANLLREGSFDVRPILAPTVAEGKERLRFCLHSYNTKEQISGVLRLLKEKI